MIRIHVTVTGNYGVYHYSTLKILHLFELREARKSCAAGYIRVNAFNASYGTESCVMSFIVNRPTNEPGFYLERQS
jgi:ribulose bisphosphate carboxylase small subunit